MADAEELKDIRSDIIALSTKTMAIMESLHDEIDQEEALEESAKILADAVAARMGDIVDASPDFDSAFIWAAAMLEDELTDLTSYAVWLGAQLYLKRAR